MSKNCSQLDYFEVGLIIAGRSIEDRLTRGHCSEQLIMTRPEKCRALCLPQEVNVEQAKFINNRIRENYLINWLVDGLPAAHVGQARQGDSAEEQKVYSIGFPLGTDNEKEGPLLHNHYEISIDYHQTIKDGKERFRVIGVAVEPIR